MLLTVLTPEREFFNGKIKGVVVPGTRGEFQVLENHAPIISSLGEGRVKITAESGEIREFRISAGFIEVLNNEVALLVNGISEG